MVDLGPVISTTLESYFISTIITDFELNELITNFSGKKDSNFEVFYKCLGLFKLQKAGWKIVHL